MRGHFDVTRLLRPEAPNALAVRILKKCHAGQREGEGPLKRRI